MFNPNCKTKVVVVLGLALFSCASVLAQEEGDDAQAQAAVAAYMAQQKAQQAQPQVQTQEVVRKAPSMQATEIADINERIAVMSARLAELEIKAKIAAKESEINQSQAGFETINQLNESVVPSVAEISGIDGKIWAVLNVPGGTQTVRVGDTAFGWSVAAIKPDSVAVRKNGRTVHLSFGKAAVQVGSSQVGMNPGMGNGIFFNK